MNDSYQVQLDGLTGDWVAIAPDSPHGPCNAVHLGEYWHTTLPDARTHAQQAAAVAQTREVRVIRRDATGRISVALCPGEIAPEGAVY